MAKSQMQRTKEHRARLKRKAQAYDHMMHKLRIIVDVQKIGIGLEHIDVTPMVAGIVKEAVEIAEAQE